MTKKKSKPKKTAPVPLVPRAGPPTNLRPGGPHADRVAEAREIAIRKALRRLDVDDDAL